MYADDVAQRRPAASPRRAMAKGTRAEVQSNAFNMPAALIKPATVSQVPSQGAADQCGDFGKIAFFPLRPIGSMPTPTATRQQVGRGD